jgi:hypothetical protein
MGNNSCPGDFKLDNSQCWALKSHGRLIWHYKFDISYELEHLYRLSNKYNLEFHYAETSITESCAENFPNILMLKTFNFAKQQISDVFITPCYSSYQDNHRAV